MKREYKLTQQPWWNRPLFGNVTLWERLIGALNKQDIPELALSLYDTQLEELRKIEPTLRMLDNEEYSHEFLFYMSLKQKIDRDLDEYQELASLIKMCSFTVKNIKQFRIVCRIELDFRGKTQVKLYNFVEQVLINSDSPIVIIKTIKKEIDRLVSTIRNEPTKEALVTYKSALEALIIKEYSVESLIYLKQNNITNCSIFNILLQLVKKAKKQDLTNIDLLVQIVESEKKELDKLGKIIGIPNIENKTMVYAKIIQYIALSYRYDQITFRFEQLLEKLEQWYKHYQTIVEVQWEYPAYKYRVSPKMLSQTPGESIYFKYQNLVNNS